MSPLWQYVLTGVQLLVSTTGLLLLFQIGRALGAWEQWRTWADKQLESIGKMVQEQGNKISEIWGKLSK
jgi:hypothetical protein